IPTRLRSSSAWLRIWIVATSATSSAISDRPMPRTRAGATRAWLRRLDIGYLQARVVGGQRYVGTPRKGQLQRELHLARPDVGQGGRVAECVHHAVAVADGCHCEGRRERGALVDDDLALRTGEGGQRRQAPAIDRDALRAKRKQQVDHILDVLEVDD